MNALEVPDEARRADTTVALPQDVLGRGPASVEADVLLDERAHRTDVLVHAPEVLTLGFAQRLAKAGADRVDHHEVGDVDDAVLVVHTLRRRRRRVAFVLDHDPLRTQNTHVEPDRRRSRPAVEGEHDRPAAAVLDAVPCIGGVAEARDRLFLVVLEDEPAGGGGVFDRLAIDFNLVLGGR